MMMGHMKISLPLPDLSAVRLRFYRQIGVEAVTVPRRYRETHTGRSPKPLVPPAQSGPAGPQPAAPDPGELNRICDRVRGFDMEPLSIGLAVSRRILHGEAGRQEDVDLLCRSIDAVGAAGLRVATWNFTALRASEGYDMSPGPGAAGTGRGGAGYRDFDADRVRGLPPLADVGSHTDEEMWERLAWLLERVVPAAATAGVRLAIHPNDPPVPDYRGVAQPLRSLAAMQRLVDLADSPANSLYLDTGVATEWGEDAAAVIEHFGRRDRIAMVHFRNVQVAEPCERYTEAFLDDGDGDPVAWMRALREAGYRGPVDPDHTPHITGDSEDLRAGWAWAVAHLRALRQVTA